MFARRGDAGRYYLVEELAKWLDRDPKFCREVTGAPDTWVIWDEVATAHLLGLTQTVKRPRPALRDDLRFIDASPADAKQNIDWVVRIDVTGLWRHFADRLSVTNKSAR
ncbi:MAG: hypothetical protein M3430_20110 [Acidobacteriota bacterium]|nr:hypothetical protein [Acidobacteriota bacterium]